MHGLYVFGRRKRVLVDTGTGASREPTAAAPHSPGATPPAALPHQVSLHSTTRHEILYQDHHLQHFCDPGKKNKTWKLFQDMGTDKLCDSEPDRVEVYYFEHGSCEFLATCGGGGGRPTVVERAARRSSRLAASLLAELLAAPQLALALPVALALQVARCVLVGVRGAAAGLVQTMSDYALKPALALAFNALLQPLLVFAANVSRGLRAALRPLAAALADVLEPAARLLAAVRLVDVHVACAPRA
ncbi:unnamed protein product [Spodoptera exigua]|nr:unnamed protein product [Spodoptera exigua]